MDHCQKCGKGLVPSATGQPLDYCSVACRRLAEFEIRRLAKRLETYEIQRDNERALLKAPRQYKDLYGCDMQRRLEELEKAISETEERLRFLLSK